MEYMTSLQSGFDELKPSLFELLSEQQLAALLPPSLRYLLAVGTQRYPRYLIRILNRFDEVYAVLSLLVERHFLLTYRGGFTENFYGLKRERVLRVRGGEVPRAQLGAAADVRDALRLRDADVWRNLAVMVGLPYLKRKLDEGYDVHAAHARVLGPGFRERDALPPRPTLRQRILFYYKWFLRHVYPSLNAAYYFALLAFNLAYLFDGSKYHNPFLWLIGTRIRRLGQADYQAIEHATAPKAGHRPGAARPGEGGSLFSPRNLARSVYPRLLSSLRILLPTSIFALKFLEWWHASDFARQLSRKATEGIELPPPIVSGLPLPINTQEKLPSTSEKPSRPSSSSSSKPSPHLAHPPISASTHLPILTVPYPPPVPTSDPSLPPSALCPICLNPLVNPTASPTGFVYCYACVHRWVAGMHPRQEAFMSGSRRGGGGAWDDGEVWRDDIEDEEEEEGSREGRWESGAGRDPVTGRKVLGGTEGLRRVLV